MDAHSMNLPEPSQTQLVRGPIKIDKEVKTAEMEVNWRGRKMNIKVEYQTPNITMKMAQVDLENKLQKTMKLYKLRDLKGVGGKENILFRDIQSNKDQAPLKKSTDQASKPERLEKMAKTQLVDAPKSSRVPLYNQPVSMIFGPSPFVFLKIKKGNVPEKLTQDYQALKERFANNKDVNVEFDDKNFTVTFRHNERELQSILAHESLSNKIMGTMTLTRSDITMKGRGSLMLNDSSRAQFQEQETALYRAADEFFKNVKSTAVSVDASVTPANLIPSLLQKHQGFCIGEYHGDVSPKRFLVENMQEFKKQGVETLFMEHMFHDSTQKWLDDYFNSPKGTPMPPYLERYLNSLNNGYMLQVNPKYNFTEVVRAAKEAGIRIVAIDTTVSYLAGSTDKEGVTEEGTADRYKAMNFVAVNIMKEESKGGKFIALMGSGHVGNEKEGIPGIADLMGCPSVVIEDANKSAPEFKRNVQIHNGEIKHVGVYLEMPDPNHVRQQDIQTASRGKVELEDAYKELKGKPVGSYILIDSKQTPGLKEFLYIDKKGTIERLPVQTVPGGYTYIGNEGDERQVPKLEKVLLDAEGRKLFWNPLSR